MRSARMATNGTRWSVAMLAAIATTACDTRPRDGLEVEGRQARLEAPAEALDRARAAADALGQELASLVQRTVEDEGPAAAVRVCSEVAQERTTAHGGDGMVVRRVSDQLRNPANAPDEWERAELERLQTLHAAGELPAEVTVVQRRGGRDELRLLRPIVLQPGCATCHGAPESIPADVRAILAERYPGDRATGYAAGDLRGAVSVRVPLE
jgi:hypothetical protein